MGDTVIRFYFSFRSPYAWLAAERLDAEFGDLPVSLELVPIYPTPGEFPNDPTMVPAKLAYIVQDILRLAREQGFRVRFPPPGDPDWSLSHAAFLMAAQLGDGKAFLRSMFRKRFVEGLDLGDSEIIRSAAREAGLDGDVVTAAANSADLRMQVGQGWRQAVEQDRIFGVPSFVYAGKLYWGQDRMHVLRRAILRKSNLPGG